jgi:ABC-type transport system involved in multi-copper enzyme maturation permease subunit
VRKIAAIAWREIYVRFTDRTLLVIMIATPLALSTIVGLAFGGLGSNQAPITDIPISIVNLDEGNQYGVNYGDIFTAILVPGLTRDDDLLLDPSECGELNPEDDQTTDLNELTDATVFTPAVVQSLRDEGAIDFIEFDISSHEDLVHAAEMAVDAGVFTAAIIIPGDFSESLTSVPILKPDFGETEVLVYANRGSPISAGIIHSIADGITNQLQSGSITIAATLYEMENRLGSMKFGEAASTMNFSEAFGCAVFPSRATISLVMERVTAEERNQSTYILVSVGSSQAMFFALFTAQFGVLSMYQERRTWTLQRMLISPTPKASILGGKLIGVFASVTFQLLILFFALTIVGSILEGELALIWGGNFPATFTMMLAAAFAVSGLGMLLAGIVKSPEQGQIFATGINMTLAVLGGAFGFNLPESISKLSLIYWGREAFETLATGSTDVGLNIIILVAQGAIMFVIGLVLFNRRFVV